MNFWIAAYLSVGLLIGSLAAMRYIREESDPRISVVVLGTLLLAVLWGPILAVVVVLLIQSLFEWFEESL